MLGLWAATDPAWVDAVEQDLDRLLSDHAHCELKAAQNALSLVGRFGGEAPGIVAPLLALVKEETEHLGHVVARLEMRGTTLGMPETDPYVVALRKTKGDAPLLLDRLLVAALIEGRSCERFKLLSEKLASPELRTFYRSLMESEAQHYRLFTKLAEDVYGTTAARRRLEELARHEAQIADALSLGPTVHG
jgi:tRNA-(ms[2]io[6]A)-hydroxylase